MSPRIWIVCGALVGCSGVALGAYGAHGLEKKLVADLAATPDVKDPALSLPRLLASYEVAVRYQMIHALALVAVGLLAARYPSGGWTFVGACFVVGVLVFCGGLYALVFTRDTAWGARVPFGGAALILGWLASAILGGAARERPNRSVE